MLFAAEQTFLAWLRTGMALMGFGFVVARFGLLLRELATNQGVPETPGFSRWFGVAIVGLGVALTVGSSAQHVFTVERLGRGEPLGARPSALGITMALLLVAVGAMMTIYLATGV